ncbi:transglycosylase SLT domain-containing protein [Bosea vaviloviae]|uniref:transglycosylase SLT domain-containing protein n=1 Tax=Bosea vaviloviae TaxID=1526658 RepID=UPI0006BAE74C|nr:transglycosylase SLT domain-containing protein [Bosea vaviloviae]
MRYTSSGAIAALAICLGSLQPVHAQVQTQVNDETDARAFIVKEAEIQRAKAVAEGDETPQQGATASEPVQAEKTKAGPMVAPAGSDGLKALVARHAAANGVPFSLADAIVRVESRYNPRASHAGNYGLMQIRHQTARGMGYAGGAGGLLDAETNARFGMKYLALAYRAAGGDTCRTIMKYQSGHMAQRMSGANRTYCAKVRTITARN